MPWFSILGYKEFSNFFLSSHPLPLTFRQTEHICWKAGMAIDLHPEAEKTHRVGNQHQWASTLSVLAALVRLCWMLLYIWCFNSTLVGIGQCPVSSFMVSVQSRPSESRVNADSLPSLPFLSRTEVWHSSSSLVLYYKQLHVDRSAR